MIDNQIGNAKCLGRVATYLARVDTAHTPMHAPSSSALDVLEPCTVVYLKTVGIVSCHCVCVLHVLVVPAGFGGVGFLLVDELARVTLFSIFFFSRRTTFFSRRVVFFLVDELLF